MNAPAQPTTKKRKMVFAKQSSSSLVVKRKKLNEESPSYVSGGGGVGEPAVKTGKLEAELVSDNEQDLHESAASSMKSSVSEAATGSGSASKNEQKEATYATRPLRHSRSIRQ